MFENAFACPAVCQFVSEDVQEVDGAATVTVSFRVFDNDAWMAMVPTILKDAAPYADDFSWVIRKEFYVDSGASVRFIWTVFVWATGGVGLGMAARTWSARMAEAARKRAAPAANKPAARAVSDRRPAAPAAPAPSDDEDAGSAKLRSSSRLKTVVHGVERDGTVRSSTRVQLGRRTGKPLYVVEDPSKRTVRATRPAGGDNTPETAASGLSGLPRVHVEGLSGYEGGSFAATEL